MSGRWTARHVKAVARIAIGVLVVAVAAWLLLPLDVGGARLVIGMFLIGIAGGAVMGWRWSPLLVPIVILATGEGRHRLDCPDCPAGDGPPLVVSLILVLAISLIPALGAAIGGGIAGLIDEFRQSP